MFDLGFKIILNRYEETKFALSYLELPLSAIKIDKKIEPKEEKIFEALLRIAKSLNIKVIIKVSFHSYHIKN